MAAGAIGKFGRELPPAIRSPQPAGHNGADRIAPHASEMRDPWSEWIVGQAGMYTCGPARAGTDVPPRRT
jgi:hypothetical protein